MRCQRCGGEFSEGFFRPKEKYLGEHISSLRRDLICIGCRVSGDTETKEEDRFAAKAFDTIRRHAQKFIKKGIVSSQHDFEAKFGWHKDRIAHDLEHAYKNGCAYCRRLFKTMGHGLQDLHVDILDRGKLPFYTTNTRFCCQTCNREKATMSPEDWAQRLIDWEAWERHQNDLKKDPNAGLPMADWWGAKLIGLRP